MPWVYQRRDPISFVGALLLAGLAVWAGQALRIDKSEPPVTEMTTLLDMPEPPAPPPPTPPQTPVQPQPVPQPVTPQTPSPQPEPQPLPQPTVPTPVEHPVPAPVKPVASAPPPPPTPAPAPAPVAAPSNRDAMYVGQLNDKIEHIKHYPNSREARQTRPKGTVTVWLELSRQGQLLGSGVQTSSGSNLLDGEALRTVRSGSYPAMPDDAFKAEASHKFVVHMDYAAPE